MKNVVFARLRVFFLLPALLLLGICSWQPTHAQNWKWAKAPVRLGRSTIHYSQTTGTAVDAAGNTYVTGVFRDTISFGSTTLRTITSEVNTYVAKLSPAGAWLWAVQAGGANATLSSALVLDATATNVYIAGSFAGYASFGTGAVSGNAALNPFVARLNAATGAWQNVVQGVNNTIDNDVKINGLALDAAGNAYVVGRIFGGTTATFGPTTLVPNQAGGRCGFVARLSAGTLAWQWAVKVDGPASASANPFVNAVAVDGSGNVVVGGAFVNTLTLGSSTLVSAGVNGMQDAFVGKLNSATGAWLWATRGGGPDGDFVSAVAVNAAGTIYVGGQTTDNSTAAFGPVTLPALGTGGNAFVASLSSAGVWQWVRPSGNSALGQSAYAVTTALRVSAGGDLFAAGTFGGIGTTFFGTLAPGAVGSRNTFLARLNAAGAWQWARSVGEVYTSEAPCLGLDPATNIGALGGATLGGNTSLSFGSYTVNTVSGYGIGYIARFAPATTCTVTGFTPATAPVGTLVNIAGTGFTGLGTTSVRFNGVDAAVTFNSATSLTATVPAGATTGPVFVQPANGEIATSATVFTVAAPPTLTAFSPTSGPVGTSVTITGTGLNFVQSVTFNGVATPFTVVSPTQLTAAVPVGASTGRLYLSAGSSILTSAVNFTVSPPTLTTFAPVSGAVGTTVTVTGTNFYGVNSVLFGSTYASTFTVVSPTQLTAVVPMGAVTGKITVMTGAGNALSAANFTVAAPALTSFAPLSGPLGATVTLTGASFTGATAVRFNNIAATSFTVVSPTSMTAVVPAGATTGKITVTVPSATLLSTANFTVTPSVPTVTGFSPATGPVGTVVTVTGTNLTSATQVKFNASIATGLTVIDANTLTAVVPTGATTGKVTVTTLGGAGMSAANFTVTTAPTAAIAQWRADSLAAPAGTQVVVPVRVRGFSGLIGMAGSLTWDPAKLVFVGVEQLNTTGLAGLSGASFGTRQTAAGKLTLVWNHAANTSTALVDNTIIFAVRFAVATNVPASTALVLTIPTAGGALEFTRADFTTAPVAAKSGKVMVTAATTTFAATLSGTTRTSTGTAIGGVTMSLKGMAGTTPLNPWQVTPAATGIFSFPAQLAGAAYVLAPQKSNDVAVTNGVTAIDIALMQRHILGTALLANAYKVVAADVDRSGTVTVADVALVRDLLLGNRTSFPKGRLWTFVRANQTFVNQNAPWPIDTARTYVSMATATAQDFVGCKLGDVNDSWNAGIMRPAPGIPGAPAVELRLTAAAPQPDQAVRAEVSLLTHGTDPHALQTTLAWDPAVLRLRTVTGLLNSAVTGQIDQQNGRLPLIWTQPASTPGSGSVLPLATLVFDLVNPDATGSTEIGFVTAAEARLAPLAADNALNPLALTQTPVTLALDRHALAVTPETATPELTFSPNPAHETVWLTGGPGTIATLFDALGRPVRTVPLPAGNAVLDVRTLTPGVYLLRVQSGAGKAGRTQRLVIE